MSPRLARALTAAYPRAWRDRYGAEFEILLGAASVSFPAHQRSVAIE